MVKYLLILALALYAAPAAAGSVVATPALVPPAGGSLRCVVSNASDKKTITVEYTIYNFSGTSVIGTITSDLAPFENNRNGDPVSVQAACVAKVLKGGSKNLRLSLYAEDSSGNIVAAVNGQ